MKKASDAARHSVANASDRSPPHHSVHVEAVATAPASGPAVRLRLGEAPHPEIILSIEQARALSLALIAAVNRQEQHDHTRRKHGRLSLAVQPAER